MKDEFWNTDGFASAIVEYMERVDAGHPEARSADATELSDELREYFSFEDVVTGMAGPLGNTEVAVETIAIENPVADGNGPRDWRALVRKH